MFKRARYGPAGRLAHLGEDVIAILGVPVDANSSHRRGAAWAPGSVRQQLHGGSTNLTGEAGSTLDAVDLGDVVVANEAGSERDFDTITAALDAVLSMGARPISIGGDHSITYPIMRAVHRHCGPVTVIHVDAHPDLYDDFAGNRLSHASPFARICEAGLCARLVQVAIRAANDHQQAQADRFGVTSVAATAWPPGGVPERLWEGVTGAVYLTIDVDGIDPAFAPGVSHPEPGGLTSRQVIDLIAAIPVPIVGADIVEINPLVDVNGLTAMLGAKLVKEIAGAISRRRC